MDKKTQTLIDAAQIVHTVTEMHYLHKTIRRKRPGHKNRPKERNPFHEQDKITIVSTLEINKQQWW